MSRLRGRQPTKYRRAFAFWESTSGKQFLQHNPGAPNYAAHSKIGAGVDRQFMRQQRERESNEYQVFPLNPDFKSQPVLGEELKEKVWHDVVKDGRSIRQASSDLNIDIRRVAAVVRLKEIEKQWQTAGKPLAKVYANAVMEMLPQTKLSTPAIPHEPINDLPVLPSTTPQMYWPVAESQHFTRVEAGKAFDSSLLPAESRIPHPQLYKIAKAVAEGQSERDARSEEWLKIEQQDVDAYQKRETNVKNREARTTTIQTPRWAFKFESVTVNKQHIGKFTPGIGQRYGVPPQDRKKGQVKIPTAVDG